MNRMSLRNNRLKFNTAGNLPIIFRGIYRIYFNLTKKNRRMSTCNRLDLQTLGSQPVMPKNLPDHCLPSTKINSYMKTPSRNHKPIKSWTPKWFRIKWQQKCQILNVRLQNQVSCKDFHCCCCCCLKGWNHQFHYPKIKILGQRSRRCWWWYSEFVCFHPQSTFLY